MTDLQEKLIDEILNMNVEIIHKYGTNIIEIWINGTFISTGECMFINKYIYEKAIHTTIFPEENELN